MPARRSQSRLLLGKQEAQRRRQIRHMYAQWDVHDLQLAAVNCSNLMDDEEYPRAGKTYYKVRLYMLRNELRKRGAL